MDVRRTSAGRIRPPVGCPSDVRRTSDERPTDVRRTSDGSTSSSDALRTTCLTYSAKRSITKFLDDACRAGGPARAGRPASAAWAPLLARSGLDWLALAAPGALAGSIWPRLARSGCPCCPGWLDLAALCAPGRPSWLDLAANDYPIDTISKKKNDLLIDDPASMLPASCALERFFMPQI